GTTTGHAAPRLPTSGLDKDRDGTHVWVGQKVGCLQPHGAEPAVCVSQPSCHLDPLSGAHKHVLGRRGQHYPVIPVDPVPSFRPLQPPRRPPQDPASHGFVYLTRPSPPTRAWPSGPRSTNARTSRRSARAVLSAR